MIGRTEKHNIQFFPIGSLRTGSWRGKRWRFAPNVCSALVPPRACLQAILSEAHAIYFR